MEEKKILEKANGMTDELVKIRRVLHQCPEVGFGLKKTTAIVMKKLREMGYRPKRCGEAGVLATVGKEGANDGRTFLLRADMDGLPVKENTGLAFSAKTGNMHACGHDLHTTMLLGAARILKGMEKSLNGRVKLLFQAAEETLEGAKSAIGEGVLTAPKVDGAMTLHVTTATPVKTCAVIVPPAGVSAPAADYFTVTVKGKSCHGSAPQNGVDALNAGAYILTALHSIISREISEHYPAVLTVGSFHAGEAANVVAGEAVFKGTLRTFDERTRKTVKKRLQEIAEGVAQTLRAEANVSFDSGCPALVNAEETVDIAWRALHNLLPTSMLFSAERLNGGVRRKRGRSEDFSYIAAKVPSVALAISAGDEREGYAYPLHHPKVKFDERALPVGAAAYAAVALRFLEEQA